MKATELMIGDWVNYKYSAPEPWKPRKWQIVVFESGFIELADPDTSCKPIPLTAEILEKNGFVFRENNDTMCGEYYLHNQSTFAIKMFNGYLVGMCMGEDLEFNYVHELQHALRLCGLEELADNFQI